MMMTILSPAARRARRMGRLRLIVLAGAVGFSGGAWAAGAFASSPSLPADTRAVADTTRAGVDQALRATARRLADDLYAFAEADVEPSSAPPPPVALAGGPAPSQGAGLKIVVTEAWALPGAPEMALAPDALSGE